MNRRNTTQRNGAEAGVALLIALFALLLISVVGVALIVASGTDTALTGNYRSATSVYYAALAGLEEGRGRLLPKSPQNTNLDVVLHLPAGTLPNVGPTSGDVWYILNPLPSEPQDIGLLTLYPDTEYAQEFPAVTAPNILTTPSISSQSGVQGPIYKWVRINAITAASAQKTGVNVNSNPINGPTDSPLVYANGHLYNDTTALAGAPSVPAIEITALATLTMPNGSLTQSMLQYIVAPISFFKTTGMAFPAALTLDGNNVLFTGPLTSFSINGTDVAGPNCPPTNPPSFPPPPGPPQWAIGYTNGQPADTSLPHITNYVGPGPTGAIPTANRGNYVGAGVISPSVSLVSIPSSWQAPSSLQTLVSTVTQNADLVVSSTPYSGTLQTGSAFQTAPVGWSQSPPVPQTIVINGDLDLSSWSGTGYGILLVTGQLTLNSNVNWNGIIIVVGKGVVDASAGVGQIYGSVLLAQTLDPSNSWTPFTDAQGLGAPNWLQTGGTGFINYSSCWISSVQYPYTYKLLSFREIPLP